MLKKVLIFSFVALLIGLVAGGLLVHFYPQIPSGRLEVNVVKLDNTGNVIKSTIITFESDSLDNFWQGDLFAADVAPFDNIINIERSGGDGTSSPKGKVSHLGDGYYVTHFSALDTSTKQPIFCGLYYTDEFDRIAFSAGGYWYIGSVSNEYEIQELIQYFRGLVPGYKAP